MKSIIKQLKEKPGGKNTDSLQTRKDLLFELLVYVVFALVLYLFYKSVFAMILLIPAVLFYHRYHKREVQKKYQSRLNREFKDALLSLSAALRAGYSMENALRECMEEMQGMYGAEAPISKELQIIKNQLGLGVTVEKAFKEFAARSKVEDIDTFAEVISIAKRTGGNLVEIIQKSASDIAAKIDTRSEIDIVIRSKKLEQNIMILMPPLIILYINLSAADILSPLYESILGRVVMTICLAVYIGAIFLSRKIMDIEV